ncbi:MAG: hypothetical protein ACJ76L_06565 [Conexibacter sp.]
MRLGRAILVVVGATVLLTALVGAASARNLSASSLSLRASFARLNFSGGFGTLECEVVLEGTFHSRTITKTVGTLSGFITAGNITRCARGAATIDRESLPWHVRYAGFTGTLPTIATISATASGLAFRVREPTFGVTCQASAASATVTFRLSSGVLTEATVSGTTSCAPSSGTLSGTTTNVDNRAGARITVTLI